MKKSYLLYFAFLPLVGMNGDGGDAVREVSTGFGARIADALRDVKPADVVGSARDWISQSQHQGQTVLGSVGLLAALGWHKRRSAATTVSSGDVGDADENKDGGKDPNKKTLKQLSEESAARGNGGNPQDGVPGGGDARGGGSPAPNPDAGRRTPTDRTPSPVADGGADGKYDEGDADSQPAGSPTARALPLGLSQVESPRRSPNPKNSAADMQTADDDAQSPHVGQTMAEGLLASVDAAQREVNALTASQLGLGSSGSAPVDVTVPAHPLTISRGGNRVGGGDADALAMSTNEAPAPADDSRVMSLRPGSGDFDRVASVTNTDLADASSSQFTTAHSPSHLEHEADAHGGDGTGNDGRVSKTPPFLTPERGSSPVHDGVAVDGADVPGSGSGHNSRSSSRSGRAVADVNSAPALGTSSPLAIPARVHSDPGVRGGVDQGSDANFLDNLKSTVRSTVSSFLGSTDAQPGSHEGSRRSSRTVTPVGGAAADAPGLTEFTSTSPTDRVGMQSPVPRRRSPVADLFKSTVVDDDGGRRDTPVPGGQYDSMQTVALDTPVAPAVPTDDHLGLGNGGPADQNTMGGVDLTSSMQAADLEVSGGLVESGDSKQVHFKNATPGVEADPVVAEHGQVSSMPAHHSTVAAQGGQRRASQDNRHRFISGGKHYVETRAGSNQYVVDKEARPRSASAGSRVQNLSPAAQRAQQQPWTPGATRPVISPGSRPGQSWMLGNKDVLGHEAQGQLYGGRGRGRGH